VVNADIREGENKNDNLVFLKTDVSSRESVEQTVSKTLERFGKIDGLVNNAGINIPALLVDEKQGKNGKFEINDELFDKLVNINQKGVYIMSQAVGRVLVNQGSGVIINMSSESGLEGSEGQSAYAATKAAINSFTRSWSKELGKKGVRVVGIAPGIMEETGLRTIGYEEALAYTRNKTVDQLREGYSQTSTIPLGRSGELKEVADLVAYFISDRSSYISGVTLNVAGGKTRG
jgi:sorbitol-6-phosphate 2-dehydrogenase